MLNYFRWYDLVLLMRTDPDWTDLAAYRCFEVYCTKNALQDQFVWYGFRNDKIIVIREKAVPASKPACNASCTSTSVSLPAVHVV